jgi:protein transport protein SEC24
MKISRFHGNFFIRGTDLLALPNVSRDSSYTVELEHDSEAIGTPVVYIQSALLYTTSSGERRIRVHTMAAPVATKTEDLVKNVDMDTMCNIIAKKAATVALTKGLKEARKACEETCVSILRGSRPNSAAFSQGLQDVSPKLQLLALYMQSLQKNSMLRGGAEIPSDQRAYLLHRVSAMTVSTLYLWRSSIPDINHKTTTTTTPRYRSHV